jgi:hypothetical protein
VLVTAFMLNATHGFLMRIAHLVTISHSLNEISCSLCSGAEHLYQVVHGAVPDGFWDSGAQMASSEVSVHILNHLFKKLNEVCLVEDGEVATRSSCLNICFFFALLLL